MIHANVALILLRATGMLLGAAERGRGPRLDFYVAIAEEVHLAKDLIICVSLSLWVRYSEETIILYAKV